jgi:uncharacterized protein (DUF58 family)
MEVKNKKLIILTVVVAIFDLIGGKPVMLVTLPLLLFNWFYYLYSVHYFKTIEFSKPISQSRVMINESTRVDIWIKEPKFLKATFHDFSEGYIKSGKNSSNGNMSYYISYGVPGKYTIGPLRGRINMPFFEITKRIEDGVSVKVLPKVMELSSVFIPLTDPIPSGFTNYRILEDTSFIKGVKEYSNEPLNRIHWAATAKLNKFMVKEFDFSAGSNVYIYFDTNVYEEIFSRKIWTNIRDKYYYLDAVNAVASLGYYCLQNYMPVNLRALGENLITSQFAPKEEFDFLEELTLVKPGDSYKLLDVLQNDYTKINSNSSIFIFTMFISESIIPYLIKLRSKASKVSLMIMPFGYSDSFTEGKSYVTLPDEIKKLYEISPLLISERILINVVRENQTLHQVFKNEKV